MHLASPTRSILLSVALAAAAQAEPQAERPLRHAARAGRAAAGVAQEAARHLPARPDAAARHRPLGGADARVQRGSRVPRARRARDLRRAAPHDLRVLRPAARRPALRRPPRASSASRSAARRRAGSSRPAARRSPRRRTCGRGRQAELWGDEQWQALLAVIEERNPRVIGIDRSTVFAFSDGLSSGELEGMSRALGDKWTNAFQEREAAAARAHRAAAARGGGVLRAAAAARLGAVPGDVLEPGGHARPARARATSSGGGASASNDLGLATWFQPSVDVQRRGATASELGEDPVIERGDVLHCDVGITAARLNTDTQHLAYVLQPGETRRARGPAPRARELERAAGHRDRRSCGRGAPATRSSPPPARA